LGRWNPPFSHENDMGKALKNGALPIDIGLDRHPIDENPMISQ